MHHGSWSRADKRLEREERDLTFTCHVQPGARLMPVRCKTMAAANEHTGERQTEDSGDKEAPAISQRPSHHTSVRH